MVNRTVISKNSIKKQTVRKKKIVKKEMKKKISSKFISHIVELGFDAKDASRLYENKDDFLAWLATGVFYVPSNSASFQRHSARVFLLVKVKKSLLFFNRFSHFCPRNEKFFKFLILCSNLIGHCASFKVSIIKNG